MMPNALIQNRNALAMIPTPQRNAFLNMDPRNALMMNPNLQRQGAVYRANMTPPDSVMDPRYPAWRQAQDQAEQMDVLSAFPGPGELASGAKALAAALLKSKVGGMMAPIVFHGSPHKFDQFDMSKIGTGEGAQAYGHGLYFAESPDVAASYAPRNAKYEGNLMKRYQQATNAGDYTRAAVLEDALLHNSPTQMRQRFTVENGYEPDSIAKYHAVIAKEIEPLYKKHNVGVYKVDLPDEAAARMLDWDKPLSQQPENVKAAIAEYAKIAKPYDIPIDHDPTGAEIYGMLAAPREVGRKGATDALRNIGIPGIRYLDQGSRDAGKGTFNYVVFSDDLPKIIGRE